MATFFQRFYLFIFIERGREGEREGEKHQCEGNIDQLPLIRTLTKDQTCNPGTCPA